MTQRLARLSDDALARALAEAGRTLPYPQLDVAPHVSRRLRSESAAARRRGTRVASSSRLLAFAALLVALLAGSAVAARLGVPGIGISVEQTPPAPPARPIATDQLFLGAPVTLDDALESVDFDVLLPRHPGLPAPQTLLQRSAAGDRISLLYAAGGELPAIEGTDVGLLVTQFPGVMERDMLEKLAHGPSQVSPVTVEGRAAWWIDGAHSILYVAPDGQVVEERLRLASRTLVWHRDGVTLRLESALDLERAVEIAESMTRR